MLRALEPQVPPLAASRRLGRPRQSVRLAFNLHCIHPVTHAPARSYSKTMPPAQLPDMIAVVTGSSGFIGSHLVDALLERGATVRALVRPETKAATRNPAVSYFSADLLDDRSVRESAIWNDATHVFHAAGVTKARTLAQFRDGNVVPTANILAALAGRSTPVSRVVVVSSQAAAGPAESSDQPVREDDALHPVEAYGRSKGEAEQAAKRYSDVLPVTIVRPAAVYGPRDVDFLKAFKQAVSRLAIHAAPRDQEMSVVYISDLVRALLLAADAPEAVGRTYFVSAKETLTWRQLYASVAGLAGTSPREVQLPALLLKLAGVAGNVFSLMTGVSLLVNTNKVALAMPKWWLCDSARVRDELGWTEEITLQHGVRDTYHWYRRAGWLNTATDRTAVAPDELGERI
jgi:nucleoside-diphosphate-sugar epimerase